MSLSIGLVRRLSDERIAEEFTEWGDLAAINAVLQEHGLPPHSEPQASVIENMELPSVSWSYSTIHYLRFIAAKFIEEPNWIPDPTFSNKKNISKELRDLIFQEKRSHLICHLDFEGYYVPIDFERVIFDQSIGGWLGSSIRLKQELEQLAEKLGFDLGEYMPNLQKLHEMRKEELDKGIFGYQKWVLLCLHTIATASSRYGSAIEFG